MQKRLLLQHFRHFWWCAPPQATVHSGSWQAVAGGRRRSQAATLPLFTCSRIYLFISYPMRASLLHRVVFVQAGQTAHKIGIFCNTQHESRAKSASSPYAACAKSSFFDSSMQRLLQQGCRPVRVKGSGCTSSAPKRQAPGPGNQSRAGHSALLRCLPVACLSPARRLSGARPGPVRARCTNSCLP